MPAKKSPAKPKPSTLKPPTAKAVEVIEKLYGSEPPCPSFLDDHRKTLEELTQFLENILHRLIRLNEKASGGKAEEEDKHYQVPANLSDLLDDVVSRADDVAQAIASQIQDLEAFI